MTRLRTLIVCAVVLAFAPAAWAAGPADAKAFYREGQTFLTWKEDDSVKGEWYKVYASDKPITAETLDKAALVAKVPEGSNHFQFLRNIGDVEKHSFFGPLAKEKWYKSIQIEDDETASKQLPDGTGLFVRTIKKPGKTYYAVTVEADGNENRAAVAALKGPVDEQVEVPGAVLLQKLDDRYYIYAIFCDYETWNPDGIEDNWEGYVHVFHVRAPAKDQRGTAEPYPVAFRLHAYTAWGDWNIGYCWPGTHVNVKLLDYHLTWWYGYSDALPRTMPKSSFPPKATVVNFTEQRVLQVAKWLMKGPKNFPFKVDNAQFCVFGGSMGGTGAHTIGVRNGGVFAAAFADEGIANWALPKEHNNWLSNVEPKFGPLDRNDMANEGVPVYDLLNLPKQAAEHPEKELPFMSIGQGIIDFVIPFHDFVNYLKALEAGKHPFSASWEMAGHSPWVGSDSPMDYKLIRRDEVVPAFANASCNTALRSGFRVYSTYAEVTEKTLKIAKGTLPPNLAGMTLVLGPSGSSRDTFKIKSNTDTELTIDEGNLLTYYPPLTSWDLHVLKQGIKAKEGKDREPTDAEKQAKAEENKKHFLICDGAPRGSWNGHFAWSTRNQNFDPKQTDDDIVDTEKRLAICIRAAKPGRSEWNEETATADVTPRRCRQFLPKPGERVHWESWDMGDPAAPKKIADGDVAADKHGLVTVAKFVIGRKGWGNRLVLTRE